MAKSEREESPLALRNNLQLHERPMRLLKRFFLYVVLALATQVLLLLSLGSWNGFLDKYLFLYYPVIWLVEQSGNRTGESKLIDPILIGVPLGVFLYSLIIAFLLVLRHSGSEGQANGFKKMG